MTEHRIGTQEEWQAERDALLKEEKELTRRHDQLTRNLPQVCSPASTARPQAGHSYEWGELCADHVNPSRPSVGTRLGSPPARSSADRLGMLTSHPARRSPPSRLRRRH